MNSSHSFELDSGPSAQSYPPAQHKKGKTKRIKSLFENYLPQEYRGPNLPNELAQKRNWTIRAMYFQCLATFTGFCLFFVRRVHNF